MRKLFNQFSLYIIFTKYVFMDSLQHYEMLNNYFYKSKDGANKTQFNLKRYEL